MQCAIQSESNSTAKVEGRCCEAENSSANPEDRLAWSLELPYEPTLLILFLEKTSRVSLVILVNETWVIESDGIHYAMRRASYMLGEWIKWLKLRAGCPARCDAKTRRNVGPTISLIRLLGGLRIPCGKSMQFPFCREI